MKAKLFMIPWMVFLFERALCQRSDAPPPPPPQPAPPNPTSQVLTGDLLVDAHHRNFYEMLRRQQQINDALILNNALLHPHLQPILPGLFHPFPAAPTGPVPTAAAPAPTFPAPAAPSLAEGTVEAPHRLGSANNGEKKMLSGVKTVLIQKKGEVVDDSGKVPTTTNQPSTTVTPTEAPSVDGPKLEVQDLEVIQLFKKLNLTKEETKNIVEHVENVVREELTKKLKEAEIMHTTSTVTPTTVTTTVTETTTEVPSTTTTVETPTTTREEATTTNPPSSENAETVLPKLKPVLIKADELILRKNNLKHHPARSSINRLTDVLDSLEPEKGQGSIKTSLTHLPIIVTNEEDEPSTSYVTPTLHRRILIASHKTIGENPNDDRDLLVDFATGAPLDLDEPRETIAPSEESRSTIVQTTPVTNGERMNTLSTSLPPRHHHHELSNFEKLASDYRQRLENTGDISKILQKISENAYISLERGGSRKLYRP